MQPLLSKFFPPDYENLEPDLRLTNPPFTHPKVDVRVTCFVLGDAKIDYIQGFWDQKNITWRRDSGEAIKILGWV